MFLYKSGLFVTWAAGVLSLSFVLTATTSLITQILEIHLHLLTGLLDRCLRCRDMTKELLEYFLEHFLVLICVH